MYVHWHDVIICLSICCMAPVDHSFGANIPAFPGAQGFGCRTIGGRGGKVLFVTNLKDYIPGREKPVAGSLRSACAAQGSRTVIFRISGTIPLKTGLRISEPYLTIAGQSAPGEGICLKNYGTAIRTHDVVLRHIRFRPGDEMGPVYKKRGKSFSSDSIEVNVPSHHVVIDHCSISWSIDECLSISGAGITDVTVQWCIISESLNDSFHTKGPHGYGSLLRTNGNVTFHHNLYAHHKSRSPRPGTYGEGSILLDFRNNVVHDSIGYSGADPVRMNYVGNYIKRSGKYVFKIGGETTRIYAAGNFLVDGGQRNKQQWNLISRNTEKNRMKAAFPVAAVSNGQCPAGLQTDFVILRCDAAKTGCNRYANHPTAQAGPRRNH